MKRERKLPFDPKVFLSKVNGGRAISLPEGSRGGVLCRPLRAEMGARSQRPRSDERVPLHLSKSVWAYRTIAIGSGGKKQRPPTDAAYSAA
jgi:hypothetical protein